MTRRGMTNTTRDCYIDDLTDWARELLRADGAEVPDEPAAVMATATTDLLTWELVRNAYPSMRGRLAAATCQRRVGTLRLFTRWLLLGNILHADPMLRIDPPARPVRLPAGWDDGQLAKLADAVIHPHTGRFDKRRWPARDWALFAVLATTGLRADEVCSLRDDSIQRESGGETLLTVIGKGNRQRNIPIPPETVAALDDYLTELDQHLGSTFRHQGLFWLTSGRPLTASALNYLVGNWVGASGVPKFPGEAAHAFRHSFAKSLVRSGVPTPTVQALLGHGSLRTTGIYVSATAVDLRDATMGMAARSVLQRNRPGKPRTAR